MSGSALRSAAADLRDAIASIPRRRYFWLALAAAAGYAYGYQDAFRGPQALGWKFGELVDRVTPASIVEARRQNAEALRDHVRRNTELPQ